MHTVTESQAAMSERSKSVMDFRAAYYDNLTFKERQEAKKRFCKVFSYTDSTFRQLLCGAQLLSAKEVKWMQDYDPRK